MGLFQEKCCLGDCYSNPNIYTGRYSAALRYRPHRCWEKWLLLPSWVFRLLAVGVFTQIALQPIHLVSFINPDVSLMC